MILISSIIYKYSIFPDKGKSGDLQFIVVKTVGQGDERNRRVAVCSGCAQNTPGRDRPAPVLLVRIPRHVHHSPALANERSRDDVVGVAGQIRPVVPTAPRSKSQGIAADTQCRNPVGPEERGDQMVVPAADGPAGLQDPDGTELEGR